MEAVSKTRRLRLRASSWCSLKHLLHILSLSELMVVTWPGLLAQAALCSCLMTLQSLGVGGRMPRGPTVGVWPCPGG